MPIILSKKSPTKIFNKAVGNTIAIIIAEKLTLPGKPTVAIIREINIAPLTKVPKKNIKAFPSAVNGFVIDLLNILISKYTKIEATILSTTFGKNPPGAFVVSPAKIPPASPTEIAFEGLGFIIIARKTQTSIKSGFTPFTKPGKRWRIVPIANKIAD